MKVIPLALFSVLLSGIHAAAAAAPLERKLQEMRVADPVKEQLVQLYLLRTNAPNAKAQAAVVKACASGLVFLGITDSYSRLRPNIEQVDEFEAGLGAPCERCVKQAVPVAVAAGSVSGGQESTFMSEQTNRKPPPLAKPQPGKIMGVCTSCRGSGKCTVATCKGGRRMIFGFDGQGSEIACSACNGTGTCLKCGGSGTVMSLCPACNGKGAVLSRSVALTRYREYIEQAAGVYDEVRGEAQASAEKTRRDEEQIAHERKLRDAEVVAKKEAIVAEAQSAGIERARQEALLKEREAVLRKKEEENARFAATDKRFLKSVVVIEGDRSVGTGFLCSFQSRKVVLSNAHVLCGNRRLSMRSIDGADIRYSRISVCRNRDIVTYEIDNATNLVFLTVHDKVADMDNQEPVVVFGNSAGGGVVTTLRGRMQGIGPDRIEVDAEFVGGNSGSPIIAYPYNAVVGMATYATQEPHVDWTKRSTRFANVRRFGVRVDNVRWDDFFPLDGADYGLALQAFEEIIDFADKEVMKAKWQGDYYRASGDTRLKAQKLLESYRATPEWMRLYADDAALAAYVCTLILK